MKINKKKKIYKLRKYFYFFDLSLVILYNITDEIIKLFLYVLKNIYFSQYIAQIMFAFSNEFII